MSNTIAADGGPGQSAEAVSIRPCCRNERERLDLRISQQHPFRCRVPGGPLYFTSPRQLYRTDQDQRKPYCRVEGRGTRPAGAGSLSHTGFALGQRALNPTFFEVTTAIAFTYFAEEAIDIAVVEVGMGGRLDATNVITPLVSVITNIDLEHTEFLGNTLELIAAEKAGIIKPGVPVVSGVRQPEVVHLIKTACRCGRRSSVASGQGFSAGQYPFRENPEL